MFVIALVAALAASVLFDVVRPAVLPSYPTVNVTLDTCALLAAVAGAWALTVNFRQSGRVRDLLLGCGLVTLGLVDLVSLDGPTMLQLRSATAVAGAPMIGSVLAASCFLVAALTPAELRVGRRPRWGAIGIGAGVAAAGAAELASLLLRGELASPGASLFAHRTAPATIHPLALLLLIAAALISALAAAEFLTDTKRPGSGPDRDDPRAAPLFAASVVLIVIGAACLGWFTPAASARASSLVAPAAAIWLAAFCLMSLGALRQLALQRRLAAAALAERQRQRLARDLHDGICQDLAFIAAHGARLAATGGDDHPIAVAARRALAASRGTLAELSASGAPSTRQALRRVADELALRFAITVEVHSQDVELQGDEREALVRIAREAILNAAEHGEARHVLVSLLIEDGRLLLRVQDDGRGLEPAHLRREGFGMRSMRELAGDLGGDLHVRACEDGGTVLEVVMP